MSKISGIELNKFNVIQFYVTSVILFVARSSVGIVIILLMIWLYIMSKMCLTTGWMDIYENSLKAAFMLWNMIAWLYGASPVDIKGIFG